LLTINYLVLLNPMYICSLSNSFFLAIFRNSDSVFLYVSIESIFLYTYIDTSIYLGGIPPISSSIFS